MKPRRWQTKTDLLDYEKEDIKEGLERYDLLEFNNLPSLERVRLWRNSKVMQQLSIIRGDKAKLECATPSCVESCGMFDMEQAELTFYSKGWRAASLHYKDGTQQIVSLCPGCIKRLKTRSVKIDPSLHPSVFRKRAGEERH